MNPYGPTNDGSQEMNLNPDIPNNQYDNSNVPNNQYPTIPNNQYDNSNVPNNQYPTIPNNQYDNSNVPNNGYPNVQYFPPSPALEDDMPRTNDGKDNELDDIEEHHEKISHVSHHHHSSLSLSLSSDCKFGAAVLAIGIFWFVFALCMYISPKAEFNRLKDEKPEYYKDNKPITAIDVLHWFLHIIWFLMHIFLVFGTLSDNSTLYGLLGLSFFLLIGFWIADMVVCLVYIDSPDDDGDPITAISFQATYNNSYTYGKPQFSFYVTGETKKKKTTTYWDSSKKRWRTRTTTTTIPCRTNTYFLTTDNYVNGPYEYKEIDDNYYKINIDYIFNMDDEFKKLYDQTYVTFQNIRNVVDSSKYNVILHVERSVTNAEFKSKYSICNEGRFPASMRKHNRRTASVFGYGAYSAYRIAQIPVVHYNITKYLLQPYQTISPPAYNDYSICYDQ